MNFRSFGPPDLAREGDQRAARVVTKRSHRVKTLQVANSQVFSITYLLCQQRRRRLVSALQSIDQTMLRDNLAEALKGAMRARDMTTVGAVRLILAKLKEVDIAARTEASREGVADDRILSMLQGMIKQRNESVVLYEKGNRPELAEKEKAEIAVIERFLPKQMDDAAVVAAVAEAMAATGAKTVKDMGGVMAALKAKYAGQMDFAKASAAVKKALAG